uniref:Flippase n=1 Tax=candidate division WOR-3 bacterium TaxID=2052148 RepID=A0A7C4TAE3_UNCW3
MSRFSKNLFYLFLSEGASRILGFFSTVLIARIFGVDGFGKLNYAFAFLAYALLCGELGLPTIGAREVSRDKKNPKIVGEILGLRISLALLMLLIFIIGIILFPGDPLIKKLVFLYILTAFPFALLLEFVFQGREEMEYIGIGRLIQYGSYIVLLLFFVSGKEKILIVPVSYFLSYSISAGFLLIIFFYKYHKMELYFDHHAFFNLIKVSLPVGLATIVYQFAMNIPPLILGIFHNELEVGYFSAGYKILLFLLVIERIVYYLFFPIFARESAHSPKKIGQSFTLFTQLILFLTIPVAIIGLLSAPYLIKIIYGNEYYGATNILRVLLLYFIIAPLNTIWGYGLVALNQERAFFRVISIVATINIILTIVSGIFFKGIGISLALLLSELFGLFLMKKELNRFVQFNIGEKIDRERLRLIFKKI